MSSLFERFTKLIFEILNPCRYKSDFNNFRYASEFFMRDLETLYKVPYHLPKPGAKVKKDSKGNLYWAFNSLYPNHEILFRTVDS